MNTLPNRIAFVIVHGALGSGKTTVLKQLLATVFLRGSYIIENEFAHENIDRLTLQEHDEDGEIAELSGGCVCCSSLDDLGRILEDIVSRSWQKPVLLETTGVASAADLFAKLYTSQTFLDHFVIVKSIMVLDALATLPVQIPLMRRELLSSDVVVISKTDVASGEVVDHLEREITAIAPHLSVVRSGVGGIEWNTVLGQNPASSIEERLFDSMALPGEAGHDDVSYAVLYPSGVFSEVMLRKIISRIYQERAMTVLRIKGYVRSIDGWLHIEATPSYVEISPAHTQEKSVVVCIGKRVSQAQVLSFFA